MSVSGIDVSHRQGAVDWEAVASAGIAFAYAKATEGATFVDEQFVSNWAGMKHARVLRGAYHFFRPAAAIEAQVDQFVSTVGSIDAGDLPPVLDLEEAETSAGQDEWKTFPIEKRVSLAIAWLEQVEQRLGCRPFIYTRSGFVQSCFGSAGQLAQYALWIAHYTSAPQPTIPPDWEIWTFWQHSQTGQVSGIAGKVDLDTFRGSVAELTALTASGLVSGAASPPEP